MKTLKGWNESKTDLNGYLMPKDEVDSELYYYFMEVLPPRVLKNYGFLVGEPYDHDNKGVARYEAFYTSLDGKRFYYGGLKTVKEFTDPNDKNYTL